MVSAKKQDFSEPCRLSKEKMPLSLEMLDFLALMVCRSFRLRAGLTTSGNISPPKPLRFSPPGPVLSPLLQTALSGLETIL